jgi:release factor glutamine methyltransferase
MDIAGQVLNRPLAWILAHPEAEVPGEAADAFLRTVERVREGHPVQYLTGQVRFWGLPLEVNEHVLIPRPETELLVQEILRLPLPEEARVLDVGTGSGAIAAALKTERPRWHVEAMDVSAAALEVASRNLGALRLDVPLFQGQGPSDLDGRWNALVSNPPYIATPDLDRLPENVRREPRVALDGGREGLDMIFALIRQAPSLLVRGGILGLEIGADQGGKVLAFSRRLGYRRVRLVNDWADIGRVFIGVWSP